VLKVGNIEFAGSDRARQYQANCYHPNNKILTNELVSDLALKEAVKSCQQVQANNQHKRREQKGKNEFAKGRHFHNCQVKEGIWKREWHFANRQN
jgi:hypothetical protein